VSGRRLLENPLAAAVDEIDDHIEALGDGARSRTDARFKRCPEIVAISPGCKEREGPETGAYSGVCEDFGEDP